MKNIELFKKIKNSLPKVFDEATYFKELDLVSKTERIPASTLKRFKKAPTKIQIHWEKKTVRDLYTFSTDYSHIDLLSAWSSRLSYLSHISALYFCELIDQQPKEYFLTQEIQTHKNAKSRELNLDLMKQVFMKGYRVQTNFCFFNGIKFFFVEKANVHEIGVEDKIIRINERDIKLRFTSVERTLLDAVVSPQYSGGLVTVLACFSKADIDLSKLSFIYNSMEFLYPYWQSIGFLLELTKGEEFADKWAALFGEPKIDFFLDRNFRSDWKYHNRWRLFVPKGI